MHYFNGKTWKEYKSLYSINKIWGTSSKDLYVVGNGGYIAHYAGESWQKMESETDISLTDIYGSPDGSVIWACGFDDIKGSVLLRNSGFGFEKIIEITEVPEYPTPNKIEYIFRSIWTDSPDSIYIGSVGRIYKAPSDTKGYTKTSLWWDYLNSSINPPPTYSIRANTKNDLFISGGSQFVRHFNGKDWHYYAEIKGNGVWTSISLLPDIIVCAGFLFEYDETAIIARGYRAY